MLYSGRNSLTASPGKPEIMSDVIAISGISLLSLSTLFAACKVYSLGLTPRPLKLYDIVSIGCVHNTPLKLETTK